MHILPRPLPFRHVHLDFHNDGSIPDIGARFDPARFVDDLRRARIDGVTLFSLCHHGWSYHPTCEGRTHPGLAFDLLRAQLDACRAAGIATRIYLSAGYNVRLYRENPDWREYDAAGAAGEPFAARFVKLCFRSPYLDHLCRMIAEAVTRYPEAGGVFLDIVRQSPCCCRHCQDAMTRDGLDPEDDEARRVFAARTLDRYFEKTNAAARVRDPAMPVFHNSGHLPFGRYDRIAPNSHLELESLPTGGWGYDHFPLSAASARKLGMDFSGMTGRFHTTWGEFGGVKTPAALRHECAAMLAHGAKCSVGDQLLPDGALDPSAGLVIGAAYREVAEKEPWCAGAASAATLAIYSDAAARGLSGRGAETSYGDLGASRLLLESHLPFDVLDPSMSFDGYDALILPDAVPVDEALRVRLTEFLARGGRLVISGASGLRPDGAGFALELGVRDEGASPFRPDYVMPAPLFRPEFIASPFVMYQPSRRVTVTGEKAVTLGDIHDPLFNRTYRHFCSHQHAPARAEPSGFAAGALTEQTLYFAHPVFTGYYAHGAAAHKAFVFAALDRLLGPSRQVWTHGLPSSGRVTLTHLPARRAYVLHVLYATPALRGGTLPDDGTPLIAIAPRPLEVIEDLPSIAGVSVAVRLPETVIGVTLEPEGRDIDFTPDVNQKIRVEVPPFSSHRMLVFHYS